MDQLTPEIALTLDKLKIKPISISRLVESSFGSKVYRVDKNGEKRVLKLFYGSREYWRERKTLELLESTQMVPRVLDGVPCSEGFDGALLLEYVENENLASSPVDRSIGYATGVVLARIHEHSLGALGFFGPEGIEPIPFKGWWSFRRHLLMNYWGEIIGKRLDSYFVQRCYERIEQLSKSFRDDEPTCLTHCDFRFGNILKRKNGQLLAIDFESAREGDGCYDFIKIWEQLGTTKHKPEWESFLEGYSSIRSLPENLEAKLKYYWFDLNFGFLYWSIDRRDEPLFQKRLSIIKGLLGS